jgi:hypothetical protein
MCVFFFFNLDNLTHKVRRDGGKKIGQTVSTEIPSLLKQGDLSLEDIFMEGGLKKRAMRLIRKKIKFLNDQRCVSTKDCFVKRVNIIIEYIRLFKTFSWSF